MITSLQNDYIKQIKKLHKRKERDNTQQFIVEGFHLIEEAFKSDWEITEVIIRNDVQAPDYCKSLDIIEVSEKVFNQISQTKAPQGIAAIIKMKQSVEISGDNILLVDAVQDPGNLGTIIRTADAAGFTSVLLGKGTVDIYNDKTIRSTQGSLFHLSLINVDLHDYIPKLKNSHYTIWATALKKAVPFQQLQPERKTALIVGNEGSGVQSSLLELADELVTIPIYGQAESLNVSVASGVLMYYLSR